MKKILSVVAGLLFSATMFAQQQEIGTWAFGAQLGAGYGSVSEVADELDDGLVYSIGVNANYQLSESFAVSAGLDYLSFNSDEYTVEVKGFKKTEQLKLDYLNIPILAHYNLTEHLGVFGGIQPGFLLSAKDDDIDIKDDCKTFSFGIPFGFSWTFNTPITLSAKYTIPCTKLNDNDLVDSKLSTIMLTLGYRFDM